MKLLIVLISLISLQAFAAQNISCWDGSCLKNGWTQVDMSTHLFTDFQCYRSGCSTSGWIVGGQQNINYYTQCKLGGCFKSGWYELNRQTQQLIQQVSCTQGDCHKFGWMTMTPQGPEKTECRHQDCRNDGWQTAKVTGGANAIYCKPGGCFNEGWIESQQ